MKLSVRSDKSRSIGIELLARLHLAASTAGPVVGDGGLTTDLADALTSRFEALAKADGAGRAARDGRGTLSYWRDHARLTGRLMALIARRWGGDPHLYRRVGELHDVDYLAHPHDAGEPGPQHPVPLVLALEEQDVHPVICCAVLEHAPYLDADRSPSSRMSAALSAAEDLATLAALSPPSEAITKLSPSAAALLASAHPEERIRRTGNVRVEGNVRRYINAPLALIEAQNGFRYDV